MLGYHREKLNAVGLSKRIVLWHFYVYSTYTDDF